MVGSVILAAGRGRRMGGIPKALLTLDRVSFLEWAIMACRLGGCATVRVVVSEGMDEVLAIAQAHEAEITVNPAPDRGMFSSVRAGLKALIRKDKECAGALIFPVDHPRVSEKTIRALIAAIPLKPERTWIQPVYEKQRGHPILIDVRTARALLDLPPECTLRDALDRCGLTPYEIPVDDPGILKNVNTPEDLS